MSLFILYPKDDFTNDSICDDINHYFFKFVHLNKLSLSFDIDVDYHGEKIQKNFWGTKIDNNIIYCSFDYIVDHIIHICLELKLHIMLNMMIVFFFN